MKSKIVYSKINNSLYLLYPNRKYCEGCCFFSWDGSCSRPFDLNSCLEDGTFQYKNIEICLYIDSEKRIENEIFRR